MRIRKPTRMFSYSTNKCKEGLMTAVFVSARSADILSSRCMYVCLLTPEFVPHGTERPG